MKCVEVKIPKKRIGKREKNSMPADKPPNSPSKKGLECLRRTNTLKLVTF